MQELAVLDTLPNIITAPHSLTTTSLVPLARDAESGNTSALDLRPTETRPSLKVNSSSSLKTGQDSVSGVSMVEPGSIVHGMLNNDDATGSSSMEGLITKPKNSRETGQWPAESAILVAVRVRPFSSAEQAQLPLTPSGKFNFSADASLSTGSAYGHSRGDSFDIPGSNGTRGSGSGIRKVVDVLDESVLVFDPPDAESISKYKRALLPVQAYRRFKDMRYAFDRVFHEDVQQQEVFENTTRHLIDGVLDGYNGTLFAYGATGCGKTHTISGTPEKPGIIFLTMQELYERMKELEDEKTIEISLSYLEVYNETIRDLLGKSTPEGTKHPSLHLREDSSKKISIAGLSEHHPKSMEALMELIFMGNKNRTMSPTEANATSSRSHAVLQINICQRLKTADVSEDFTVATLSLIDLAGSERASVTKNRGARLMEGANINKSLLALGNCINALCENKPKSHIPYRDSKLTRLLKFSLGGNCKTVMIACVSPSSQHYEETHNTLKYANRAKNIKTKVTKNTLNVDRHVSEYVQAIYELRQEVAELKSKLHNQTMSEAMEKVQQRQLLHGREFEETIRKMKATLQASRPQEATYAELQSQLVITAAQLSGLYRWRAGFDQASQAAKKQYQQQEQEGSADDSEANVRAKKLTTSLTASSSYISMVDNLIQDLNDQTVTLANQMQEHEDALKLYAMSIQAMEKNTGSITSGFPYQKLYEMEKKCQTLQSHNKILIKKLELSDRSLSEQFLATEDFMELSARSLVGLRPEIETIEQAGLATKTLNDIYLASITSFTDMSKRIGSSLTQERRHSIPTLNDNLNAGGSDYIPGPSSPFKRSGLNRYVGLDVSRIMSIFPEIPQTPVKRPPASHVMPNLSMDTVDTNLALGSSGLFGSQSPVRMYQERHQMSSPQNPFLVSPIASRTITTPRKKSTPMAGVVFSPKRRRARGGLRPSGMGPTPTKRSVNFLLDVVAEDEDRYSTGWRDPSLPPLRPPSLTQQNSPSSPSLPSASRFLSANPSLIVRRESMGGGAKRLAPAIPRGINGHGGARRLVSTTSGSASTTTKTGARELSKGPQRIASTSNNSVGSSSASNNFTNPAKRNRLAENDSLQQNGKRLRSSPTSQSILLHGVSAATAARIARRQNTMSETNNPFQVAPASSSIDRNGDIALSSPSSTQKTVGGKNEGESWPSRDLVGSADNDPSASTQGLSRIPVPSPPSRNNSTVSVRIDKSERRKSITVQPKSFHAGVSQASRRRSMGPRIGSDSGSLLNSTDVKRIEQARIGFGSGIGGGAIRDVAVRRRARATISPPQEIPSFNHLVAKGPISRGNLAAPSNDTQANSVDVLRAKRRVRMMAAPAELGQGSMMDISDKSDPLRSTTIPAPIAGSSRRRSLGPGRTIPLSDNDSVAGLHHEQDYISAEESGTTTTKPVNRRRSMFTVQAVSPALSEVAEGFGFGQASATHKGQQEAAATTAATVQANPDSLSQPTS
ncbi:kinesin-like protein Klp5 [Mortierella polycephala]|uniref:Kinesin-like protein Klp5 n=1 Tax=Mortierella polycephala TaxID=41804 RepID=A0A9P6QEH5_9FUNG|nr:kinesin-like protein Klp5 [Mortierella polycephala]